MVQKQRDYERLKNQKYQLRQIDKEKDTVNLSFQSHRSPQVGVTGKQRHLRSLTCNESVRLINSPGSNYIKKTKEYLYKSRSQGLGTKHF